MVRHTVFSVLRASLRMEQLVFKLYLFVYDFEGKGFLLAVFFIFVV